MSRCSRKVCAGAVAGDDAGAFLPAMLQREEAVIGQNGRVRMTEDAEKCRTRAAEKASPSG